MFILYIYLFFALW